MTARPYNRILASLPRDERATLESELEEIAFDTPRKEVEPDQPMKRVYFPVTAVFSVVAPSSDGLVEVATIGNEGFVGLPVFLGATSAKQLVYAQIPGRALTMSAAAFKRATAESTALTKILLLYTQALFNQIAQASACNRLHNIHQRCARWMLLTQDRAGDEFQLTHEFLAQMLGVRRAGVTEAASAAQESGLITYRRGVVRVLDREGLERASCDCYATIARAHEAIFARRAR